MTYTSKGPAATNLPPATAGLPRDSKPPLRKPPVSTMDSSETACFVISFADYATVVDIKLKQKLIKKTLSKTLQ